MAAIATFGKIIYIHRKQ